MWTPSLVSAILFLEFQLSIQKTIVFIVDGLRRKDIFGNEKDATITQTALDTFPHLNRIIGKGVKSGYVKNEYPPRSIPNLHSILTGVSSARHQMIDDTFFDALIGSEFNTNDERFYSHRSTEKEVIVGTRFTNIINASIAAKESVVTIGIPEEYSLDGINPNWNEELKEDFVKQSINLILPTKIGHTIRDGRHVIPYNGADVVIVHNNKLTNNLIQDGINDANKEILKNFDNKFSSITDDVLSKVNIIFITTFGLVEISDEHEIELPIIKESIITGSGPLIGFWVPQQGIQNIKNLVTQENKNYKCYSTDGIPEAFTLGEGPRIPTVVCKANYPYYFKINNNNKKMISGFTSTEYEEGQSFLFVAGPSFRNDNELRKNLSVEHVIKIVEGAEKFPRCLLRTRTSENNNNNVIKSLFKPAIKPAVVFECPLPFIMKPNVCHLDGGRRGVFVTCAN